MVVIVVAAVVVVQLYGDISVKERKLQCKEVQRKNIRVQHETK